MAAPKRTVPTDDPLEWPGYTASDMMALKALQYGNANEQQQKLALDWIMTQASRYLDVGYLPRSDRDTSFLLGRIYVGKAIARLLAMRSPPLEEGSGGKPPP